MNELNKSDIIGYIHEGFSGNQILDMIVFNEIPTVKAIPLDKVKQAREEINHLYRYFDNDCSSSNKDSMFKCCEVLVILDKLIAESEEK